MLAVAAPTVTTWPAASAAHHTWRVGLRPKRSSVRVVPAAAAAAWGGGDGGSGAAVPHASLEAEPHRASSKAIGRVLKAPGERALLQHTLRHSFVIGGIGLHTGEYAVVRVAPAFAGDGRYFVRVPPGAISPQWDIERPSTTQLDDVGNGMRTPPPDPASGTAYLEYIESVENGAFAGTFSDYMQQLATPQLLGAHAADMQTGQGANEQPTMGHTGESRLPADVGSLQQGHRWCTVLAREDTVIWGAEHLLAALECCGVHNARVEVEGGKELPIIDGSALGWASEILRAGVQIARDATGAEVGLSPCIRPPQEVVTVQDGESFISLYPGPTARVTVGIDYGAEAPVIGEQWFSWSPRFGEDSDFFSSLAPARTCFASKEQVMALMEEGLLQAGPDYVSNVGNGEQWLDAQMVRFPADEAARHAVVALLGDLSLLAHPGGRGIPTGHVVAYQPTRALLAAWLQKVQTLQ